MAIIGRTAAALAVGLALGGTVPVVAEAGVPQSQVLVTVGRITGTEARDLRTLEAAMRDMDRRGYPGLTRHLPALKAALDRAPADYGIVDRSAPNRWIVRSDDLGRALILSMTAATAEGGKDTEILQQTNVYGTIAMLLGSEAVERHAYQEAITLLDKGLAFQPDNGFLTGEKASALQGMGQHAAVLTLIDESLPKLGLGASTEEALLHRRRGASLIELGRLEEAKAAFEESIEVLPENPVARNELEYIRQLQAGAAQRPLALIATPTPTSAPPAAE
ncbi:hypothetical protein BH09PSE1_BH09PSE1_11540 [soil metagenome]